MSESMNTILLLGGTSGIGEAFARRWVSMGKKVILTGRRQDRLDALKQEMPEVETYNMDMGDFKALPQDLKTIQQKYPDIDTVWVNGGIQGSFFFNDSSKWTDEKIIQEMNTNATAPILVARHYIPQLLALKKDAQFMFTSSGIAYIPSGVYPVYSATKAAVHHFAVALRQQMKDTNVSVIEIAPPYVDTALDANHKEVAGGMKPMPLQEYTDETFKILDANKAKDLKEVAVGFAAMANDAWRGSIGAILDKLGFGG